MTMRRLGLAVLIALIASPSAVAQVVKGDPAAYARVQKAFAYLRTARSYRMRSTSPLLSPAVITNEFVNPDRWRSVDRRVDFAIETIRVGTEWRLRIIRNGRPERWSCLTPRRPPQEPPVGSSAAILEAEATDLGVARIDGTTTRLYHYRRTMAKGADLRRVYLQADTGVLRRQEILRSDGTVLSRLDYYDYNAPIKIDLPACGSVTPVP